MTAELNAAEDNPLASVPDQMLISNGNFHPMVLAIACDALRIALAQVGQLSERRMSHLWDGCMQQLTSPPTATLYGLHLRYPAAALFPELKQLAAPATLDTPPLDLGVEDHHTAAPLSVRKTDAALGLLEDLLAIELMLARDMLATASSTSSAPALMPPFAWSRRRSPRRTRSRTQSTGPFESASQSGRRVRPQPTGEVRHREGQRPALGGVHEALFQQGIASGRERGRLAA